MQPTSRLECRVAIASVALGLAVSAALTRKDAWFIGNLSCYWLPQVCVLAVFCVYRRPRPAAFAGMALALAAYLALFWAWLFSRRHPESLAWLGYLSSLPGAVVGPLLALLWLAWRQESRPAVVGVVVGLAAVVGIAIGQTIVCSTVMYCLGK